MEQDARPFFSRCLAMAFKDSPCQFQMLDLERIDPAPDHVRKRIEEESLQGLINAIGKFGLIQPIVVRAEGDRFRVLVGERRRQAARLAGETRVPVLIRDCDNDEALEIRVFENIGLGVRSALEARDMANAVHRIAERFASPEEAATYFGRAPTWLAQATAAAKLSEKVTDLLETGKIGSTGAAVQLEKLARKDEAKAESLIEQISNLPEGEKISKKALDHALAESNSRLRKDPADDGSTSAEALPEALGAPAPDTAPSGEATQPAPWETQPQPTRNAPEATAAENLQRTPRVHPGKVKLVAELLGLEAADEETILACLIDEFIALKQA